ncbi:MAG TPA: hypothetical protein VL400_13695 [Polyangiaceae bacterium]|nr:hypothetical protein [Polyangiaceae bacterium]
MRGVFGAAARRFRSERWPLVVSVVAFVLVSPTIAAGYFLDDWVHLFVLEGNAYPGGPRGAWDLYHFADAGPGLRGAIEQGLYPWWSSPDLKLAFFRPLTSLWRAADIALFGRVAWPVHLETCLLYAALAYGAARFYRRTLGGAVAGLAALLFAVDDAHALSVVWIANRHALLAGALGIFAVAVHTKRIESARSSWPAALAFAVALLAGETALGAFGYVLAFELVGRRAPLGAKLASLAPHVVVLAAWAAVYKLGGYGGGGNAFYLDPAKSPGEFLAAFPGRAAKLALGQLFVPPSELWAMVAPDAHGPVLLAPLALAALVFLVLARVTRGHPAVPWLAAGAALSLVPLTGTIPDDRLLVMPGLGAMGVVAVALERAARAWSAGRLGVPMRVAAAGFGVVHLVLAPLLLPLRAENVALSFGGWTKRTTQTLPPPEAVAGRDVIAVVSVDAFLTSIAFLDRYYVEAPRGAAPQKTRILAIAQSGEATITRDGPNALVVRATRGMYGDLFSTVYSKGTFTKGELRDAGDMRVQILEVDDAGHVLAVRFELTEPLEEKRWVVYEGKRFVEIDPPKEGAPRVVAGTSFMEAIQP